MSYLNSHLELRLSTIEDAEQILKIYECEEFDGNISVMYTRRPNPYLSLLQEGEQVILPVIYDHEAGILCGVGGCVIREATVQGEIKRTGYLTGLKILPAYRKKISLPKVYQFLYEHTKDLVDLYYTTILIENTPVQKMFEKKRKNMPTYELKGIYTVYCFKTGKLGKVGRFEENQRLEEPKRLAEDQWFEESHRLEKDQRFEEPQKLDQVREFEKSRNLQKEFINRYKLVSGHSEKLQEFYEKNAKPWSLFPVDFSMKAFSKDSIYTLQDEKGEIFAACVLWNQQAHKQYIVINYKGIYKYLQRLPLTWFGYPNLPKCNQVANYANYHMLCVKDNDPQAAAYFIRGIAEKERGYDFLMLGLFENHYIEPLFQKVKHIKYQSKFYEVKWEETHGLLDVESLQMDVGLL